MTSIRSIARIPGSGLLFLLIFLSGFAEVFGISALVPVVTSMMDSTLDVSSLGAPFNFIPKFLMALSIEPGFGSVLSVTFCIMFSSFLLIHLQERVLARSRYKFVEEIRNTASRKLFESRWEHLSSTSTGELSNKLMIEADRGVENVIALVNVYAFAIHLIAYLILALLLSWEMSLLAITTLSIAYLLSRQLIVRVGQLGTSSVEANNAYNKQIVDVFKGSKLVRALGIESYTLRKLADLNGAATTVSKKILINQSLMKLVVNALIALALTIILYTSVSVFNIEFSVLAVFLFIVLRLAPKFYSFQGQLHSYSAHRASLDIIDNLIADSDKYREYSEAKAFEFRQLKNSLSLENVSYTYPGSDRKALDEVSIEVKKNQFVAVVGASGAGKSTLLDLLLGLLEPHSGVVTVDGLSLNSYSMSSYRSKIGFVPQESVMFDGSIAENISLGAKIEASVIAESLNVAQILDFVSSLPEQLKAPVGESGDRLSGGQRQRLSIARALARQPEVLILDEATSSLDSKSEDLFQKALESIASRYTLVVVAHRISTIRKADMIYVLDQGRLVESGDYETLIQKDSFFAELNKNQLVES
jgi:ABC-type multidrug transport system fused ATPase/permease subunit